MAEPPGGAPCNGEPMDIEADTISSVPDTDGSVKGSGQHSNTETSFDVAASNRLNFDAKVHQCDQSKWSGARASSVDVPADPNLPTTTSTTVGLQRSEGGLPAHRMR